MVSELVVSSETMAWKREYALLREAVDRETKQSMEAYNYARYSQLRSPPPFVIPDTNNERSEPIVSSDSMAEIKVSFSNRKMKIRRSISLEEIEERWSKGLCVFCAEPETPHHHFKHKKFGILMIDGDENQLSNEELREFTEYCTINEAYEAPEEKSIVEEEPTPQFQVPITITELSRSVELGKINLELEKLDVVKNENLELEGVQKNSNMSFEVASDVERVQKVLSMAKYITAHQMFCKLSHHKEKLSVKNLRIKTKMKRIKTWMFKFRKQKSEQGLGYDLFATYLENKTYGAKLRVSKRDKEYGSDESQELKVDPVVELKKSQETERIEKYHEKFEWIRARVNLSEEYMVSVNLAELRLATQTHIKLCQPKSIQQCLLVGRLYETAYPTQIIQKGWYTSTLSLSHRNIQQFVIEAGEQKEVDRIGEDHKKKLRDNDSLTPAAGLDTKVNEIFLKKVQPESSFEVDSLLHQQELSCEHPRKAVLYKDKNSSNEKQLIQQEIFVVVKQAISVAENKGSFSHTDMISKDHKQQVGDNELLTTVAVYDTKVNKTVVREGNTSKNESDYQSLKQEAFVGVKKSLQQPESTGDVFKVLQGVDRLQHNGKKRKGSKSWMFKYKNQRHVLEKLQSDSIESHSVSGIAITTIQGDELSAVTFSWLAATLQSISEDAFMQRRCRMWFRQTLQDLQQFIHGEVTDQIKHKWRFKLLHIISELVFNLESVAISPTKYLVQKLLVKVAGKCRVELQQMTVVLNTHMHFGSASHYVWRRCKATSSHNFGSQVGILEVQFHYNGVVSCR